MAAPYQDWEVRKKTTPVSTNTTKYVNGRPVARGTFDKDPGDDAFGPKQVDFDLRKNLERARNAAGLTRRQLADKSYIKESTLAAWESGAEPIPQNAIPKLERALGTHIRPPKPAKK